MRAVDRVKRAAEDCYLQSEPVLFSLRKFLDANVFEADFHAWTAMQLERDDALQFGGVVSVGRHQAIQCQLDVVAVAQDLVIVPVLGPDDSLAFTFPAVHENAPLSF